MYARLFQGMPVRRRKVEHCCHRRQWTGTCLLTYCLTFLLSPVKKWPRMRCGGRRCDAAKTWPDSLRSSYVVAPVVRSSTWRGGRRLDAGEGRAWTWSARRWPSPHGRPLLLPDWASSAYDPLVSRIASTYLCNVLVAAEYYTTSWYFLTKLHT